MKKILVFTLFLIGFFFAKASNSIEITDSTTVSLLTCSPGKLAYEKFGHTAIRIKDTSQNIDFIANWGLFDFSKPNFYIRFIEGKTYYLLGIQSTEHFLLSYAERNSQVTEQILNLTPTEKEILVNAISENYLPENREYLYNFVYDNCATRPYDLIINLFNNNKIHYNNTILEPYTFRQSVAFYADSKSWLMFGIDIIFGREADKIATQQRENFFLPEFLSHALNLITINSGNENGKKLVQSEEIIVAKKTEINDSENSLPYPLLVSSILLILVAIITTYELRSGKHFRVIGAFFFILSGAAGIIIVFLMFFSIHPLVGENFNLLWCNPLNLIAGFLMLFRKMVPKLRIYHIFNIILLFLSLIVFALSIQHCNLAFLPLIGILLLRTVLILRVTKNLYE